jgi:hypothetical protein
MFEERISKNGVTKICHNVVKNAPFTIQYGCTNIDFSSAHIHCQLLYDSTEFRPIPFLSKQPLEYVVHPSNETNTFTVEFRIKVLSSQYEHSLFLIQLTATLPSGNVLIVTSAPIRCVSKPDQIRRKKEALLNATETLELDSAPRPRKRKREDDEASSSNEEIIQMLQCIHQTQLEQTELIKRQAEIRRSVESTTNFEFKSFSFEEAFINFFTAFNKLDENSRAIKLHQILANNSPDLLNSFNSFVKDLINIRTLLLNGSSSLTFQQSNSPSPDPQDPQTLSTVPLTDTCNCPECPFKKELIQLDQFYEQLLSPSDPFSTEFTF